MKRILLILGFIFFFVAPSKANHCAAGEILYSWISDSTYIITFKFYRDCAGIPAPPTFTCYCVNSTTGTCLQLILNPKSGLNGQTISVGCPNYVTKCNGGFVPGYQEWIYEDTITLPSQSSKWVFWIYQSARNNGISNISFSNSSNFYCETTFNNLIAQGNSSPYFTTKPIPYICVNTPFTYNMGAFDINSDSLSYSIIQTRTIQNLGGNNCAQTPIDMPFSSSIYNLINNPLSTNNTFTIDAVTGQINFTPNTQQIAVVSVLVREWRNGVLIGSVLRDLQIVVNACPANPALTINLDVYSITNGAWTSNQLEACAGESLSFCLDAKSSSSTSMLVINSNNATVTPGSVLSLSNNFTDSIRACFSWTPSLSDTGLKILTIVVKDSVCVPPGIATPPLTYTIPIYIWPRLSTIKDTTICSGNSINLIVNGSGAFTWSVLYGSSLASLSCTSCPVAIASPMISTSYLLTSNLQMCSKNKDTVTISVVPTPVVSIGSDTVICFGDTLQLFSSVAPAYPLYKYTWTPASLFNNPSIPNPYYMGVLTKNIKLTVTTPLGCMGTDEATIHIVPLNFLNPYISKELCPGDSAQLLNAYPVDWIRWYPDLYIDSIFSNTPKVWPSTSFLYTAVAKIANCIDTASILVDVKNLATLSLPDTVKLYPGDTYQFMPLSNCLYFHWSPAYGLDNPTITTPTTSVASSIIYTVDAKTEYGCKIRDSVVVLVEDDAEIDVANAFSPGSAPNATIKVQHHGIAKLSYFRIFNRWGEVVFQTTNIDETWDGKYNGIPQPMGTYIYAVEAYTYRAKRFYKQGNIFLIR